MKLKISHILGMVAFFLIFCPNLTVATMPTPLIVDMSKLVITKYDGIEAQTYLPTTEGNQLCLYHKAGTNATSLEELRQLIEEAQESVDEWDAGISYQVNDLVKYNDLIYKVLQAHTSQSTWTPNVVPALFVEYAFQELGEVPGWVQPTGGHDAYNIDDRVWFEVNDEKLIYESVINANVWSPTAYPAGWKEIGKIKETETYGNESIVAINELGNSIVVPRDLEDSLSTYCVNVTKTIQIGTNTIIAEWINETWLIYHTDTYEKQTFKIQAWEGTELIEDINWIEIDGTIKFFFNSSIEEYNNLHFRVYNDINNSFTFTDDVIHTKYSCTETQFYHSCEPYTLLNINDMLTSPDNNVSSAYIEIINNELSDCWNEMLSFWSWEDFKQCKNTAKYFDLYINGTITDTDPALELVIDSSTDTLTIQHNQTEATNLGVRTDAPVLFMNFNKENESTYVQDNSIYNKFGTIVNATYNSSCGTTSSSFDLGGCFEFDGDDRIQTQTLTTIAAGQGRTLAFWVKSNFSGTGSGFYQVPVRCSVGANSCGLGSYINRYNAGKITFYFDGSTATAPESSATITDNEWHFVVGVNNGTRSQVYVDGLASGSSVAETPVAVATYAYIGGNDASAYSFNGSIDQIQVWDRALSADEILNLYNGTKNNTNYIGKYFNEGDFKSLVYYNSTSTYWNITQSIADSSIPPSNYDTSLDTNLIAHYTFNNDDYILVGVEDDGFSKTGSWVEYYYADHPIRDHMWRDTAAGGGSKASFSFDIEEDGEYYVYTTWYSEGDLDKGAQDVPFTVTHDDGDTTIEVNQSIGIADAWAGWYLLGKYNFTTDNSYTVNTSDIHSAGVTYVNAILVSKREVNDTITDINGNYNLDTRGAMINSTDGIIGKSAIFNARNSRNNDAYESFQGDFNTDIGLDIPFTISGWIKTDGLETSARVVMISNSTAGSYGRGIILYPSDDFLVCSGYSTCTRTDSDDLTFDNTWHHIVAIYDGGGSDNSNYNIYVDGKIQTLASQSGAPTANIPNSIAFGGTPKLYTEDGDAWNFNGQLDEFRIYNTNISESQARALYSEGLKTKANLTDAVAYFPLDDTCSIIGKDNYCDLVGGNDGTPTGTNNATGISSGAMKFDGENNYINITNLYGYHENEIKTMSAFVYPFNCIGFNSIIGSLSGVNVKYGFGLEIKDNYIYAESSENSNMYVSYPITCNQWNHVAMVINQSKTQINLYLNGELVNSTVGTAKHYQDLFLIGAGSNNGVVNAFFNGSLDEVLLYNKSLSTPEIQQLYKAGLSQHANANVTLQTRTADSYNVSDAKLVGLWGLNGDANDDLGVYNGSVSGATVGNEYGVVGQGYYFDGINDVISFPMNPSTEIGDANPVSVSLWAYSKSYIYSTSTIFNAGDASPAFFLRTLGAGTTLQLDIGSGDIQVANPLGTNEWHHIVAVYDGAGMSYVYADGILLDTDGTTGSMGQGNLIIGCFVYPCSTNTEWDGYIDEVRVYNRTLTQEEIQSLYELGSAHILWNEWQGEGKKNDGIPKRTSSSGKFMQFRDVLNTDDTTVSPYVLNYSVSSVDYTPPIPSYSITITNPTNLSGLDNETISYQFEYSTTGTLDTFSLNDTSVFNVNQTGFFVNSTELVAGLYMLNLSVNTTTGDTNNTIFEVLINSSLLNTSISFIDNTPYNISQYDNVSVYQDINHSTTGIFDKYSFNATYGFLGINSGTGIITNTTTPIIGKWLLNVSINNTDGKSNSSLFYIEINQTPINYISRFIYSPKNKDTGLQYDEYCTKLTDDNCFCIKDNQTTFWTTC